MIIQSSSIAGSSGGVSSEVEVINDNANPVPVSGDVGILDQIDLTNANPATVAIVDANGDQITSFGGGVQYTQGDTDASITGTAAMMEGAGDTLLPIQGTIADGLLVNLGANNDVSVNSGDNTIGRVKITDGSSVADVRSLAFSTGLNVAVVDSLGNQVSSFGGSNTQYTEDTGGVTDPVGTVPVFIRQDTPTGLVTTDGDIVGARGSNFGAQYVTLLDSSGGFVGTRTVQGTAAEGAAISGNPVLMGGENPSGNVKPIQVAADGDQIVHQHSASTILADAVPNTGHIPINETDAGWLLTPTFPYVFNGSDWDRTRGNATDGLLVNLGSNNDVTGTVTANAGTNLNTSALALESGGNLAAAVTALQIMDDWDESDRAKVNPIVGQAGVQGGSGAVSATTQRVVLATDVALPAGTNTIGKVTVNRTVVSTLEASYNAAQTNVAIVSVSGGSKIVVTEIQVINDAVSPNIVSYRIGFAAATTPTTTGVLISHPGAIPGTIHSRGSGGGVIGEGADGEDLRITSDAPGSGGEIRVVVTYYTEAP